jgi:ribonuclease HIII
LKKKIEKYSGISEIDTLIQNSYKDLLKNGFEILSHKDIQYGTNFEISSTKENFILSIYYTPKKGYKLVFSKLKYPQIENEIKKILFSSVEVTDELNIPFDKYIGMDEAGKGDYFGPLVIAGFIYDKSIEKDLIELGVSDSKTLTDEKILQIARSLMLRYPERVKINEIKPPDYNKRISDLKKIKGNLNTLLALGYTEILSKCEIGWDKYGAVIDKFAQEEFISRIIHKDIPGIRIFLAENAERNLAVAAASIIARAVFVKGMYEISCKFKLKIPFGAGAEVTNFARIFLRKYGENELFSICKYHFKITHAIEGSLF